MANCEVKAINRENETPKIATNKACTKEMEMQIDERNADFKINTPYFSKFIYGPEISLVLTKYLLFVSPKALKG